MDGITFMRQVKSHYTIHEEHNIQKKEIKITTNTQNVTLRYNNKRPSTIERNSK